MKIRILAHALFALLLPALCRAGQKDIDIFVYSTAAGGGSLAGIGEGLEGKHRVTESFCAGGLCLYSTVDPGFRTANAPSSGLFPLSAGTEVRLEVVAIAPGMSIQRDASTVDAPGESLLLGSTPDLHTHPQYQVTLTEGEVGDFPLRFRLTATGYGTSPEYDLVFTNGTVGPTPTPTPTPTATPGTAPTVAPIPDLARSRPRALGDQAVFYYDAREGFTSFVNLANEGSVELDVEVLFYDAQLAAVREVLETIPAGGTRTIDVGSLRSQGLAASAGVAFATAVDAGGAPIASGALAGNFTVANLATSSAWGGPAAAREAWRREGLAFVDAEPGAIIDGVNVVLEQIAPTAVDLSVYYDPASLEPAAAGGNQVIFVSFADVSGLPGGAARQGSSWQIRATRNDGGEISASTHQTEGVEVSHLAALVGPGVEGAAGSLRLWTDAGAANRLVFFQESLGTFATGYLLPAVPPPGAAAEVRVDPVVVQPGARGDQLVFYYDARDGFTTFLNLANEGEAPLDVKLLLYDASIGVAFEVAARTTAIPPGGTRTIDVGALRNDGLAAGPGMALAYAVDGSGGAIASDALAGSFTVANLGTLSAWGAPAAARRALVSRDDGGFDVATAGTPIDGDTVVLEQIQPERLDLSVYYDPNALEPAEKGGNQILFVSFADAYGASLGATAAGQTWDLHAARNTGDVLPPATRATSGVEVTHLVAAIGPGAAGSAGRVSFEAVGPAAGNRFVYFVESLGTFATGYLLPAPPRND